MANGQKRAYHKLDFSLEEEESLIDFVKQNNVLYNPKHRDYKNKMFRDRIWEDIAATLKKTGHDCQRKWINIRDAYQKSRGKKLGTGSAAESTKHRNELLAFLNEVSTVNKRTTSNIIFDDVTPDDEVQSISDDDDNEEKENALPMKRRRSNSSNSDQMKLFETFTKTLKDNHTHKMNLFHQAIETSKPLTELELFFSSICKTVEKLKPIDQAKMKMQISSIVAQAELAELQSSQQQQFPPPPANYTPPLANYYPNQNIYYSNSNGYYNAAPPQTQNNCYPSSDVVSEHSLVTAVNTAANL